MRIYDIRNRALQSNASAPWNLISVEHVLFLWLSRSVVSNHFYKEILQLIRNITTAIFLLYYPFLSDTVMLE